jgi:hypothetical protein
LEVVDGHDGESSEIGFGLCDGPGQQLLEALAPQFWSAVLADFFAVQIVDGFD